MSTWIPTFAFDTSRAPAAAPSERAKVEIHVNRVALVAIALCALFVLSDHDWTISRYEEFSETSDVMEQGAAEGNVVRRLAIFGLGAAGIASLLAAGGYLLRIRGVMGMLIVFTAGWCAASALWAAEPGFAMRRLIATGCVAAAALALAKRLNPRELAAVALISAASLLALGILVEMALGTWHPWRGDYRFAGTLHPNNQGLNCALLVIAAVELARQIRPWRLAMSGMAVVGLIGLWLTKSRTPLAALVGGEMLFWFLACAWKTKLISALTAVWVVCAALLIAGPTLADRVFDAALLGRNDDEQVALLTGRVPLWEELSESIAKRPLQGYGFNSFWTSARIDEVSQSQSWAISVAHSTYLDLALGVGVIGAGLWIAVALMGLFRSAYYTWISGRATGPLAGFAFIGVLLAFGLLHGALESAFANPGFVPLVALSGLAMLAFVDPADYQRNISESDVAT